MIAITTLSLVIIFLLVRYYTSFIHYFAAVECSRKIPGPPSTNKFIGNVTSLFDTPENIFKVLRKWGREYYPIYKNRALHLFAVNILDPHDFETIMANPRHNTKGYVYYMFYNWLGTGLLTSNDAKWQERRKILTPSFHFNILQEFVKVFTEETGRLIEVFRNECNKPFIPINDFISDFTLNTIAATAMGTNFDEDIEDVKKYKNAIREIGKVYVYRVTRPWLFHNFLYFFVPQYFIENKLVKILHKFTENVIFKREKNFTPVEDNQKSLSYSMRKRLAMLDLLISAKREGLIDDEGIREEVNTFMFEGHDTTSVAICYALMLIACNRDVQDRLYEEIQQTVPSWTQLNINSLQELKYMERCIKEVLRIYPSVPYIARVLGNRMTTHSGYLLRAGTMVQLHIYDVHHNPDIYPDPEKFDPDRFLPENTQNRHNFAYIPFSAGSRNCIGQKFAILEMKTVLSGIISEFILEPVDTPSTIELTVDVVLRTKQSIRVKFIPRK